MENYLFAQIFIVSKDINIKDFIKENSLEKFLVVSENENLKAGDCVIAKRKVNRIHIVKPNETLFEIAKIYNVTEDEIKSKNRIIKVFAGQQLIL